VVSEAPRAAAERTYAAPVRQAAAVIAPAKRGQARLTPPRGRRAVRLAASPLTARSSCENKKRTRREAAMFVAIVLLTVATVIAVWAVTVWIDAPRNAEDGRYSVFDA
jgi:hypothetical protein